MALKLSIFERENVGKIRAAQEDSHGKILHTPNGDVFVLCDGMGGHVGGKQASSVAVASILEYLQKQKYDNIRQALDEALQFANMQIIGCANEHPELKGMGTTACILLVKDDMAYIAHVGDSRIYLYLGKERELHRITKDHSYVQALVDLGEITDEEAENHPNKNQILKALGIKPNLQPTIVEKPILAKKGDTFLLCSDGLTDMVTDSVIEKTLSDNVSLESKGNNLIKLALDNGGFDNVTIQLIEVSDSPHKQSEFRSFNPKNRPSHFGTNNKCPKKAKKVIVGVLTAIVVIMLVSGGIYWGINYRNTKKVESAFQQVESAFQQTDKSLETLFGEGSKIKQFMTILSSSQKEVIELLSIQKQVIERHKNLIDEQIGVIQNIKRDSSFFNKLKDFKNNIDQLINEILNCKTGTDVKKIIGEDEIEKWCSKKMDEFKTQLNSLRSAKNINGKDKKNSHESNNSRKGF